MQNSMMRSQTTGPAQAAPARPAATLPVAPRTQRVVKCAAKGQSEGAPNQVALKFFGALAAAQLAVSGPAMALDLIPDTIKSQAARDEANKRTSNLPSLGGVAKGLNSEFGESSPQEVGQEVAKNAPDVDLTANPKELGEQAGDAIKDAGKEVAKQSPVNFITMLDLPSPQDLVGKITGSANDAAGQAKGAASDAAGSAKGAASEVQGKAKSVAKNSNLNFITMLDLPSPQDLVGKITGSANDAAGQAKGAASDAAGSAKGAASEAKGKAKSVANYSNLNFITMLDLPSAQDVASKAQGAVEGAKGSARDAGNKAQSSVKSGGGDVKKVAQQGNLNFISLLQLPSPQELAGKITGSANDAAGQAKGAANDVTGSAKGAASDASGSLQGAGKEAAKKAPVSTLTFALANPAGNAQDILGKAKTAASDASAKAQDTGKKATGKAKSATEKAASSAKSQVKGAAS